MNHSQIASILWAFSVHGICETSIYSSCQIFLPAISTKLMPTTQTIFFILTFIELIVANHTPSLVISSKTTVHCRCIFWQWSIKFYSNL